MESPPEPPTGAVRQNGPQNARKSSPGGSQDALGARLPLEAILGPFWALFWTSRTPKNRALAVVQCYFLQKWHDAPGSPKSTPK